MDRWPKQMRVYGRRTIHPRELESFGPRFVVHLPRPMDHDPSDGLEALRSQLTAPPAPTPKRGPPVRPLKIYELFRPSRRIQSERSTE